MSCESRKAERCMSRVGKAALARLANQHQPAALEPRPTTFGAVKGFCVLLKGLPLNVQ